MVKVDHHIGVFFYKALRVNHYLFNFGHPNCGLLRIFDVREDKRMQKKKEKKKEKKYRAFFQKFVLLQN